MSITAEKAADAFAAALLRCQQLRFAADARRAIAAALDGAYCTKALLPRFAALFPGDRVHYYTASYSGHKMLIITRTTATGARLEADFMLCRRGEKRIDTAHLIETAADYDQRRARIEQSLSDFYENLAQYNVLSTCLSTARGKIADVMYCLDRFQF